MFIWTNQMAIITVQTEYVGYKKTLYGLKQSGHEWNKELDRQLKAKGFVNL